jgi:hypothetical protein
MKTQPESLCMGCLEPAGAGVCPMCGWSEDTAPVSPLYLRPRTVLDGRYLLGRVLGAGGFGITYLGWDLNLGMKLAIKEYFPSAFGARDADRSTVIPTSAQGRKIFDQGLERFLDEGRALAKFQGHPCIASVLTFFRENGTSYLVMKYEEGITLQAYLQERGGRIDYRQAMSLAMPVMDALRVVHQAGILHRDISPDNMFINRAGQVKILDFGSAKHDLAAQNRSTQITLKRGYSPEEQYRSNGKIGPWTDVYALGATIYQTVTGQIPPESLDRLDEDLLQPPSQLGIQLPNQAEEAIMRALAVRASNRFQTIKEFQDAMLAGPSVTELPPRTVLDAATQPGKTRRWRVPAAFAAGVLCVLGLLWMATAAPQVNRFDADPGVIAAGRSAVLRWSVDHGSVAIEPGIGQVDESRGERTVTPPATTTYKLTASRFLRSVTRSVVIVVSALPRKADLAPLKPKSIVTESPRVPPPRIISFNADPPAVSRGQSTTLTWSVEGKLDALSVWGIGRVEPDGSLQVSPPETRTYSLRATGPAGSDSASVQVIVNQSTPSTQSPPPQTPAPQTPSHSDPPGILHIEIFDEKGQSMPALIEVEGIGARASEHILSPTHTGLQEGKFPPGIYRVKVTARGYAAGEAKATIVSGVETLIQVHMVQAPK